MNQTDGVAIPTRIPPLKTGRRILFVASAGGHLTELHRLSQHMAHSSKSIWLTFDSPQSRSLLQGSAIMFVPYVSPRDIKGVIRTWIYVARLLRKEHFDEVVSTGAAVAVGAFLGARAHPIQRTYIESIARVHRPSLTGRLISLFRLADLRTQTTTFGSRRWTSHPSVLKDFESFERAITERQFPLRVFVTVGTIRPYRFDELLKSVRSCARVSELEVTWQTGVTDALDLPGVVHSVVDPETFRRLALEADVVVTHAGVGSLLVLFEMGIFPVVVPRRADRREHVDDHQLELAEIVKQRGLGLVVDAQELDVISLREAARHGVREPRSP